ncbi:MAG: mltG [Pseudomonas sp.]|uniref:endolytic transglycosylase MltG n=1 Tax=Pseudomonas sp. TaxID=306 RepID=UPI00263955EE|nr:endolytic transglycosylase MltG [Pseudomonas sp.]MDB6052467.1 mltG [Pseudomonas sp.]
MRRLLIVALLIVAAFIAVTLFRNAGGAPRDVNVVIPVGSSLTSAAKTLEENGAIKSSRAFLTDAKLFGSKAPIKPGEYHIARGMGPEAILRLLQSGRTLQRFVVIPEGMPSILVQEKLMATPLLTGNIAIPQEGSLLPDAYAYTRGESRAAVVGRMQKAMQTALANAWKTRKPTTAVTTPEAAIILASIVEKETALASERRMVAGVYSNRLKRAMPLQADPTTIYPVTRGKPLGRRILRSELQAENGYNTYRKSGLPIGPITNPGKASILAVLDPAPTQALYFVANGTGGSSFADTLSQHSANVQKYYALRRARGEM